MNLHHLLRQRAEAHRPVKVGIIGAGRFGTMFLAQARAIRGVHVVAVADLNGERAREAFRLAQWPDDALARDVPEALRSGGTAIVEDALDMVRHDLDVVVEATGNPIVGIAHAVAAIDAGQHVVMVTVEADALAGPALAQRARAAGVTYSMAYGDQSALIMELVDWARTSGFDVVCAGKGAKYLPGYHQMNPDNVWDFWEFSRELTDSGQLNPYMHTSFRDGTKAAIEMAAVANAAGLVPSDDGLSFAPGDLEEIASVCCPRSAGGVLAHEGTVDVMSSYTRDGQRIEHNTQEGVFVVVRATNDYVSGCFAEYPWHPDPTRTYAALYRPYHYVGLELNVSIASAALRGEPTGSPVGFTGDVVAVAKKDLPAGSTLDGEGGYAVRGSLVSAATSVRRRALPVAMAHHVPLLREVREGQIITWDDVDVDNSLDQALALRAETEKLVET